MRRPCPNLEYAPDSVRQHGLMAVHRRPPVTNGKTGERFYGILPWPVCSSMSALWNI